MQRRPSLTDSLGRIHTNLRMSVTDRCNIRCFYCMPEENVEFKPRDEILTFEELIRFARITSELGVNKIRLTGGEPLLRKDLPQLIRELHKLNGITDIALTTNAVLLADQAEALKQAGLDRINISLDTLNDETFFRLSRRRGIDKVLEGIQAAQEVGMRRIRLNAIAIRGLTETEILPLAHFALERSLELRFIEFMPLDADDNWGSQAVLTGQEIRQVLEKEFGALLAADRPDASQPAVDFRFASGEGRIGFINPVSEPFCDSCNRLRITSRGDLRLCLFGNTGISIRHLLQKDDQTEELQDLIMGQMKFKKESHYLELGETGLTKNLSTTGG